MRNVQRIRSHRTAKRGAAAVALATGALGATSATCATADSRFDSDNGASWAQEPDSAVHAKKAQPFCVRNFLARSAAELMPAAPAGVPEIEKPGFTENLKGMQLPYEAVVGGLFIGVASGVYMLLAQRVAGNSGALKALVLGPAEPAKLAFLAGLCTSGAAVGQKLKPDCFEIPAPPASPQLLVSGMAIGLGTVLGNGCTSGHGLCGISRLSRRSIVAVCVFMGCAAATATLRSGQFEVASITQPDRITPDAAKLALALAGGFGAILLPLPLLTHPAVREMFVSVCVGLCFGTGLALGGMVRPSVVLHALSPESFDPTLWILFSTALGTTFVLYRLAAASGVAAANFVAGGAIDLQLLLGASLFGIGWGSCGFCPGPLLVAIGADPTQTGPLVVLLGIAIGMRATSLLPKGVLKVLAARVV